MNFGAAFGSLALLTVLSRVSGFVRVAVFAALYGGTEEADVFLAAMVIPELLYRLVGDGLMSAAGVPLFASVRADDRMSRRLFWNVCWSVILITALVSALLAIFAEPLCSLYVPGFPASAFPRLVVLWRLMVLYILLAVPAALMTAFLNARDLFARPALGPLLVNGITILGLALTAGGDVVRVGWWVVAGAAAQAVWLGVLVIRNGAPLAAWSSEPDLLAGTRRFLRGAAATAGWLLLTPAVPLCERYLLSMAAVGSVAVLNYTDKILNFPLGIVSLSLAKAVFPSLSRSPDGNSQTRLLGGSLWLAGFLLVPIVTVLQVQSEAAVAVVYHRGRFALPEVEQTALLMRAYSWSLFPWTGILLFNRWFFARDRFRVPFVLGSLAVLAQIGLMVWGVRHFGSVAVGWAAAGTAWAHMLLLTAGWWRTARLAGDTGPVGRPLLVVMAGLPLLAGLRFIPSNNHSAAPAGFSGGSSLPSPSPIALTLNHTNFEGWTRFPSRA
jgi:putative peptidoglycan lipid II flippase